MFLRSSVCFAELFKLLLQQTLIKLRPTLCITPKLAVAVNFAQFVARPSHSKLFLRNVSLVVPQCMKAFAITVAE